MSKEKLNSFYFVLFIVGLVLFTPDFAYAYLDASTGSIIFQAVVAVIAGLSFSIKIYWKKIKSLFFSEKNKIEEPCNDKLSGSNSEYESK